MTQTLKKAKGLLEDGGYTCVVLGNGSVCTDTRRGVAPLLSLYDGGQNVKGYSAADKVVGNGAAYLYVLLGIGELYAEVISESAKKTLESYGVTVYYGILTEYIRNRTNTGACPIEQAVADALSPEDALKKIRARLGQLSKQPI